MKIPYLGPSSLCAFLKSAREIRTQESEDGSQWRVYETDVEPPEKCPQPKCGAALRLRRNGNYARQAFEGVICVMLLIHRFRCGECGGTVSRPPSFLVPHRRFTASLISQAIDQYGESATSYGEISGGLSVYEDGNQESPPASVEKKMVAGKDGWCPARNTVFSWVDFVCKRISKTVHQVEKELVLQGIDTKTLVRESAVTNKNAWKAGKNRGANCGRHQKEKEQELRKLTYGLVAARSLTDGETAMMDRLRAYFLQSAEKCLDLLSDVSMVLPITQMPEQVN
jgi:hypothetical protein